MGFGLCLDTIITINQDLLTLLNFKKAIDIGETIVIIICLRFHTKVSLESLEGLGTGCFKYLLHNPNTKFLLLKIFVLFHKYRFLTRIMYVARSS